VPATLEVFVGFGRVFSGTLRAGQEVWVLGPRYVPGPPPLPGAPPPPHATRVRIGRLFLLMGRDLEEMDEVRTTHNRHIYT
jgi:ribosome assembly protein 1